MSSLNPAGRGKAKGMFLSSLTLLPLPEDTARRGAKPLGKRQYGFTLTELLIVISILALLAAILLPVFLKVRERARTATCADNLHHLYLAVAQYSADNGGPFPDSDNQALINTLYPYTHSKALWHCPSDSTAQIMSYNYLPAVLRDKSGNMRFGTIDAEEPKLGNSDISLLADAIGCKQDAADSHGGSYNAVFLDGHLKSLDPCNGFR